MQLLARCRDNRNMPATTATAVLSADTPPLAFDQSGERFDVAASADGWRVRRFNKSGRGTPETLYDDNGRPLIIALDTDHDEFRDVVANVPGRYRLDPVSEDGRTCADTAAAYIKLKETASSKAPSGNDLLTQTVLQVVETNNAMVRDVVSKLGEIMKSAAQLINAADGAGLAAREPLTPTGALMRNADAEGDAPEPATSTDRFLDVMTALLPQVVPAALDKLSNNDNAPNDSGGGSDKANNAAAPKDFQTHYAAVAKQLKPEEIVAAAAHLGKLSDAAKDEWKRRLIRLSASEAAAAIRDEITARKAAK